MYQEYSVAGACQRHQAAGQLFSKPSVAQWTAIRTKSDPFVCSYNHFSSSTNIDSRAAGPDLLLVGQKQNDH